MDFINKNTAARIAYLVAASDKDVSDAERDFIVSHYTKTEAEKIYEEYNPKFAEIIDDEDYSDIVSEWCDSLLDEVNDKPSDKSSDNPSEEVSEPDEISVRVFISDLILLAQSDGNLDNTEGKLIRHIARKAGMTSLVFSDIVYIRQVAQCLDNAKEQIFEADYEYSLMRPYADSFDERTRNLKSQLDSYLNYYTVDDKFMCCEKTTVKNEITVGSSKTEKPVNVLKTYGIAVVDPVFGGGAALIRNSNNKKAQATAELKKANEEALLGAENRMSTVEKQCKDALNAIADEKTFILTNSFRHFIDYLSKIKNVSVEESEVINEVINFRSEISSICETALPDSKAETRQSKLLTGAKVAANVITPAAFAVEAGKFFELNKEYEKARAESADVQVTVEKMNIQAVKLIALRQHIYLNYMQLLKLDSFFSPMVFEFRRIQETQGLDYSAYDENARKIVASACSLAKTLKVLIDTPVLTETGEASAESNDNIYRTDKGLAESLEKRN